MLDRNRYPNGPLCPAADVLACVRRISLDPRLPPAAKAALLAVEPDVQAAPEDWGWPKRGTAPSTVPTTGVTGSSGAASGAARPGSRAAGGAPLHVAMGNDVDGLGASWAQGNLSTALSACGVSTWASSLGKPLADLVSLAYIVAPARLQDPLHVASVVECLEALLAPRPKKAKNAGKTPAPATMGSSSGDAEDDGDDDWLTVEAPGASAASAATEGAPVAS